MPWESALLEREQETDLIIEVLARVSESRSGRVLLIEGDAGLGKTRLLRHLRDLATSEGYAVLSARASALEQSHGLGVVRQLLERPGSPLVDPSAHGSQDELGLLHTLYWQVAETTADQPCVLLVDDVQWSDPESLRFLEFLRIRLDDLPLVIGLTARTTEPDLPASVAALLADPDAVVVRPRPLGDAAAAELLGTLLDGPVDPAFAAACRASTAGNPLLLTVLAGSVRREGLVPSAEASDKVATVAGIAVRDQVARRLEALSPGVRRVAEAVAALGTGTPATMVAEILDVDVPTVVAQGRELADRGLLEQMAPEPDPELSFRHPMSSEAVLGLMTEPARQALRLACADVLEAYGVDPEMVAAHVLRLAPGVDPRAADRLRAAAASAQQCRAIESAVSYLVRALAEDLPPDQRLNVLRTGGELALHTDLDAGISFLERAVAMPEGRDDPDLWADLGTAYGFLRRPQEAVAALRRAVDLLPPGDGDRRRAWEASLLVAAAIVPGYRDTTLGRLDELRALPPADGIGARMLAAALAFHDMAALDRSAPARAREALADGLLLDRANGEGPTVCAWLTLIAADDPVTLGCLDEAVRRAQDHGSFRALAAATTFRAFARQRAGSTVDAVEDGRAAVRFALEGRADLDPGIAAAYLAQGLLDLGQSEEAEQALRHARALSQGDIGPGYYQREAAARLRRVQGRYAESLRLAEEARDLWARYGFDNPSLGAWRTEIALSSYRLGEVDRARELVDEEVEVARRWAAPGALGRSLRIQGLIRGGEEGLALLRESVDVLDGSTARLELARSLGDVGAALRRLGRRTQAGDVLVEALDLATACASAPLVEEIVGELQAAGFRPRRHRVTGPDSLTQGERRVADLAATGWSNRAIARSLFVSTKTVELHLTNVYRKLEITGRSDLGAALGVTADGHHPEG